VDYSLQPDYVDMIMIIPPGYSISEGDDGEPDKEKVFVVVEGILKREYCMVAGLLCIDSWNRLNQDTQIPEVATKPGFRSSEA
jgi:hypothetical protein